VPTPSAAAGQTWVSRGPRLSPNPDRTGLRSSGNAVLVVDDDAGVLRLTARILRLEGYRVLEAGSGTEALRILDSEPDVRLVLTDVVMPEMHGLDLATRIMEREQGPRVVLMTGHGAELSGRLERRDPAVPLLLKPFTSQQLVKTVRKALSDGPPLTGVRESAFRRPI
jgi:two-component system, cell cycle sensor histidine kinase and response regulator CckA